MAAVAELHITVQRPVGIFRRPVPVRVVTVADQVQVRSWHRRDTGRFGDALASVHARIRVPGAPAPQPMPNAAAGCPRTTGPAGDAHRAVNGPELDPVLRGGVLKIPPIHPVYPWSCTVLTVRACAGSATRCARYTPISGRRREPAGCPGPSQATKSRSTPTGDTRRW
ncbi:DUF2255 family protein [Kitasatospora sp. NPDC057904]|uniref:DUF2255 family protein n=1 Tax=Kitasatospora sp. NPDC057904 TaxID=3346275 RepID=UPI0036DE32A1